MTTSRTCPECAAELEPGRTICATCGWDATTAVTSHQRTSVWTVIRAGGWRLVVYGVLLLVLLGLADRYKTVGPGPDLETTLRWIVLGDGGRAAELVTIQRAVEVAAAASRFAVTETHAPPFDGDWEDVLAPYATMHVRGWIPLLFVGATTDLAPSSVKVFFRVDADDGWGRPYRVRTRAMAKGSGLAEDPQVAADLDAGLRTSIFSRGTPDFRTSDWLRLELTSAGPDGDLDTPDDLVMTSYVPVGRTLNISGDLEALSRDMERAYILGRHYFRLEGNRYDLIDARLLAEFRLDLLR